MFVFWFLSIYLAGEWSSPHWSARDNASRWAERNPILARPAAEHLTNHPDPEVRDRAARVANAFERAVNGWVVSWVVYGDHHDSDGLPYASHEMKLTAADGSNTAYGVANLATRSGWIPEGGRFAVDPWQSDEWGCYTCEDGQCHDLDDIRFLARGITPPSRWYESGKTWDEYKRTAKLRAEFYRVNRKPLPIKREKPMNEAKPASEVLLTAGDIQNLQDKLRVAGVGPDAPTVTNANGAKQSGSPYRCDLLPPLSCLHVAGVLKHGAEKYGPNNWHGIPVADHINHALTHVLAHLAGDSQDDHLGHAACRMMMALEKDLMAKGGVS